MLHKIPALQIFWWGGGGDEGKVRTLNAVTTYGTLSLVQYVPSEKPSPINLDSDPKKDLAAIHHLCVTYEKSLTALLPKQVSS